MKLPLTIVALLAAASYACDAGENAPAATTPQSTAATAVTAAVTPATPQPTLPAGVDLITIGDDAPFPSGVVLYIETGCYQCDGPTTGLVRMYRDPAGAVRQEPLEANFPGVNWSIRISADGTGIAVSGCSRGVCDGFNPADGTEQITTVWSRDGGVTWQQIAVIDGLWSRVVAVLRDRVVVTDAGGGYVLLPGGAAVAPPAGAAPRGAPFAISATALAWRADDGKSIIGADGRTIVAVDGDMQVRGVIPLQPQLDAAAGFVVALSPATPYFSPPLPVYWADWSVASSAGGVTFGPEQSFTAAAAIGYVDDGDASHAGPIAGNAYVKQRVGGLDTFVFLPALLDLQKREVRLMRELFGEPPYKGGRNYIAGVMRGPVARVAAPGDCVNVREAPGAAARALECARDGVLLVDVGGTSEAGGQSWRLVRTPLGTEGWASARFLEFE